MSAARGRRDETTGVVKPRDRYPPTVPYLHWKPRSIHLKHDDPVQTRVQGHRHIGAAPEGQSRHSSYLHQVEQVKWISTADLPCILIIIEVQQRRAV